MKQRFAAVLAVIVLSFLTTVVRGQVRDDCLVYNKDGLLASRLIFESAHRRTLFIYNKDGSVKTRELQEINDTGATTKRTVYKADGALDHTYEEYYSNRNYLSRTNCYDAKGELDEVDVYFDDMDVVAVLDGHGKFLRTESTFDPTIPVPSIATPYPGEFPERSPTPKPPLQRFTDIRLSNSPEQHPSSPQPAFPRSQVVLGNALSTGGLR